MNSIGSQVWVSSTIFLTINLTLLGGLFYKILDKNTAESLLIYRAQGHITLPLILAIGTIICIVIIVFLCFWKRWLKRMKFHTANCFERMGEIESLLSMKRVTRVKIADNMYDEKNKKNREDKQSTKLNTTLICKTHLSPKAPHHMI